MARERAAFPGGASRRALDEGGHPRRRRVPGARRLRLRRGARPRRQDLDRLRQQGHHVSRSDRPRRAELPAKGRDPRGPSSPAARRRPLRDPRALPDVPRHVRVDQGVGCRLRLLPAGHRRVGASAFADPTFTWRSVRMEPDDLYESLREAHPDMAIAGGFMREECMRALPRVARHAGPATAGGPSSFAEAATARRDWKRRDNTERFSMSVRGGGTGRWRPVKIQRPRVADRRAARLDPCRPRRPGSMSRSPRGIC